MLQVFDIRIEDKNGLENVAADHLSQLVESEVRNMVDGPIDDLFPDEMLFHIAVNEIEGPWFADISN